MLSVAYRAPWPPARVPSTHKPCSECGRVLPRATHYRLRYADNPFNLPDGEEDGSDVPGDRVLCVQPRCIACDNLRRERSRAVTELRRKLSKYKSAVVKHDSLYHTVEIRGRVPRAIREMLLEPAARAGLIVVDEKGEPFLPKDPEAALRVCYAGVLPIYIKKAGSSQKIRPSRIGHFGREQIALLKAIPGLVNKLPDKHPFAKLAQDVVDVALVREWGDHSEEAMDAIIGRLRRKLWKFARAMVDSKMLRPDEAETRFVEGIYDGVRTWDPLHPSCAALLTHCGHRVKRSLQLRGRKDHRIAARKDSDGRFRGGAASLDTLMPPKIADEGAFVPHARSYSTGAGAVPSVQSDRREESRRLAIQSDVAEALEVLDPVSRRIVEGVFLSDFSIGRMSEELGMTTGELRRRVSEIKETLQVALASYQEAMSV